MRRRPPRSTRTDPHFPYTARCRSAADAVWSASPWVRAIDAVRAASSAACWTACPASATRPPKMMTETISRSEEHTSELQSLMRISYAVFCLKKQHDIDTQPPKSQHHKTKLSPRTRTQYTVLN